MKRQHLTLTAVIIAGLLLTACGGHATSQKQSSNNSENSTSETKQSSTKSAAEKATMKPYQVPKSEKAKQSYQRSGLLTIPGQFSYDKAGTKLTLSENVPTHRTATSKGLVYQVTDVKRITNNAKTHRALSMAEQAFNISDIPNPYQTVQLKFKVKNNSSQPVKIDGIKAVTLNGSRTISSNGLNDQSAGQTIGQSQTRAFSAMILTGPTSFKINSLSVKFSGSFDESGASVSAAPETINLKL